MRNFYEDFENVISEHSHGIIDAYNRGLVTIEETLATIMDYKRNADIAKAKAENSKPKRKTYFKPGADIPKTVRNKTYYNMKKYHLDLYDAFNAAIRSTPNSEMPPELIEAWYLQDLRNYIPSAYIQ